MPSSLRDKLKWLDPFTYVDVFVLPKVNPYNKEWLNWVVYIVFAFLFAFIAYSLLGFLLGTPSPLVIVVSGSMEPTLYRGDVAVLQGVSGEGLNVPLIEWGAQDISNASLADLAALSMEGGGETKIAFKNGQSILVPRIGTGDIVVYFAPHKGIEIIHRAVAKVHANGKYYVLTKGDNNWALDQDCGVVSSGLPTIQGSPFFTQKPCASPHLVGLDQVKGRVVLRVPWIGNIKLLLLDDVPSLIVSCMRGSCAV